MDLKQIEVLNRAINKYGPTMQKTVAIEEMSELTKEIVKDIRDMPCRLAIAEEIADVEIMLEQLKMIYGAHEAVERFKVSKINRLNQRISQ